MVLALVGAGAAGLAWLVGRETAPSAAIDPTDQDELAGEDSADDEEDAGAPPEREVRAVEAAIPTDEHYQCALPAIPITRDPRCESGAAYPECRWQLPDTPDAQGLWVVWRNTTPEHRWARPGLVTLVMTAAAEYQRRWPGEHVTIGDLDAPGPRHQTHDRGVDVDMYLEEAMLDRNEGPRQYVDNYAGRAASEVVAMRARVTDLARILATCANGRLRIYYNDPEVLEPFVAWFAEHGFVSDVGPAMMMHNRLHRFHFHMTVPEDLPPIAAP
jgi:hypothetical protein